MKTIRLAIIGCGYVADFYMQTAKSYSHVEVVLAFDINPDHAARFSRHWKIPSVTTAAEFYDGLEVDAVLNLTNPDSHFEVSRMALEQGQNVYSEKPLAMSLEEIETLRDLALSTGLSLASAPCNHLSEAFDALRGGLEAGHIGQPLLAYAEMDDGFIAQSPYESWINPSGAPWPYEDEFEVGCTLEHAGYYLTWLIALFGSVTEVHAFTSLRYPGKPVLHGPEAPDFSVACLTFETGMVARLTCGVVAPRDHNLKLFGDQGLMTADDCWFYDTPVGFKRWIKLRRRFMLTPWTTKVPVAPGPVELPKSGAAAMDFIRGPLEMIAADRNAASSRLPLDFCVHFNEVSLAIHSAQTRDTVYHVKTRLTEHAALAVAPEAPSSFFERRILPLAEQLLGLIKK